MDYLTLLDQTVNANLNSGRIGTPVFVRWTASMAESKDLLKTQLAEMSVYTGHWLSANVRRLYVTGAETQGHLSLALDFVTGTSALLALTLAHKRPHIALAIYGNLGALYHNEYIAPVRDGSLSFPQREDASAQAPILLLDAIEQSLALHQPVELAPIGGQP